MPILPQPAATGSPDMVTQIVPEEASVPLAAVISQAREARPLIPFADAAMQFLRTLSNALFSDSEARRYPELQAVAFWMRASELTRLREEYRLMETPSTVLVPRGLVFHIPPSNVDTIFMYSWILSTLAGNTNIIRISERAAGPALIVCRLLRSLLERNDDCLKGNTTIIRYARNAKINALISSICDVRVVWGGDATVDTFRKVPLPSHAQELTFPDRHSLCVIGTAAYAEATSETKDRLAAQFYNDTFWFDQMACSSPRMVLWCGDDRRQAQRQGAEFFTRLRHQIAAHSYALDIGNRVNKLTFVGRAILDGPVEAYHNYGGDCAVLDLSELTAVPRDHCGGGLLYQAYISTFGELAAVVERKDQTLSYFGFDATQVRQLAKALNGRGIDRIVPIGQALSFNRYWDGYDLLRSFTRVVSLQ